MHEFDFFVIHFIFCNHIKAKQFFQDNVQHPFGINRPAIFVVPLLCVIEQFGPQKLAVRFPVIDPANTLRTKVLK